MRNANFKYYNVCHPIWLEVEDDPFFNYDKQVEEINKTLERYIIGYKPLVKWYEYGNRYPRKQLGYIEVESRYGKTYATIYITINTGDYIGACLDYVIVYNGDNIFTGTLGLDRVLKSKIGAVRGTLKKIAPEVVRGQTTRRAVYQNKLNYVRTIQGVRRIVRGPKEAR